MIGGGSGSGIGGVHRMALALDGRGELVAGALSSTPERSQGSAREIGLSTERSYDSWQKLIAGESALEAGDRVEAVSVVTPNHSHFEIARACLDAGFHVVLDKPMVCDSSEASRLAAAVASSGVSLTVTYNYSGYPLIREARHLVASGAIGAVRKVIVEYHQGWLASDLESSGHKQASWRTDPAKSGGAGALGDIGTHAEHLARFVTGQAPSELCADVRTYVGGRRVDDDASVFLRYASGASGVLTCSQVCIGSDNGLTLRVFGDAGSIAWQQESSEQLVFHDSCGKRTVMTRGGDRLSRDAADSTRTPPGHPEGFIEAFANIYRGAIERVRGIDSSLSRLAPTVEDGAAGVRFVEKCLSSKGSWVSFSD
jgi:predicted dehydrogenase